MSSTLGKYYSIQGGCRRYAGPAGRPTQAATAMRISSSVFATRLPSGFWRSNHIIRQAGDESSNGTKSRGERRRWIVKGKKNHTRAFQTTFLLQYIFPSLCFESFDPHSPGWYPHEKDRVFQYFVRDNKDSGTFTFMDSIPAPNQRMVAWELKEKTNRLFRLTRYQRLFDHSNKLVDGAILNLIPDEQRSVHIVVIESFNRKSPSV